MKLKLKVVPSSSRNQIVGRWAEALKIKVAAPPERGKANRAVIKLLADALGIDAANIRIVAGETSSNKVVEITGLDDLDIDRWGASKPKSPRTRKR